MMRFLHLLPALSLLAISTVDAQNSNIPEFNKDKCDYSATIEGPDDICDNLQIELKPLSRGHVLGGGGWFKDGKYIGEGGPLTVSEKGMYEYKVDNDFKACYLGGKKSIKHTIVDFDIDHAPSRLFCNRHNVKIGNNKGWMTTVQTVAGEEILKKKSLKSIDDLPSGMYKITFQKEKVSCTYERYLNLPLVSELNTIVTATQYLCGSPISLSSKIEYETYIWEHNGKEVGNSREYLASEPGVYTLKAKTDQACFVLCTIDVYDPVNNPETIKRFFEGRNFYPTEITVDYTDTLKSKPQKKSDGLINLYDGEKVYQYETPTSLEKIAEKLWKEFALLDGQPYELTLSNNGHFCINDLDSNYEEIYEHFGQKSDKIKLWFHIFEDQSGQDFVYSQIRFPYGDTPFPSNSEHINQLVEDNKTYATAPLSQAYANRDEGLFMTQIVHLVFLNSGM